MTDRTRAPLNSPALMDHEPALAPTHGSWESSRVKRDRAILERRLSSVRPDELRVPWPALAREAHHGRAKLAFTFAGQGAPWLAELRDVVKASTRADRLVRELAAHLEREVHNLSMADAATLDEGLPLSAWLDGQPPSEATLWRAAVSAPCLFITQMARAESLLEDGFDALLDTDASVGVAGHSQGTLAAACFSELWGERDLDKRVQRAKAYVGYYLYQGLRMEQAFPEAAAPALLAKALEDGVGAPSPMAAVSGLLEQELQAAISKESVDVRIAVLNAPFYQTVSGAPAELERLRLALSKASEERAKAKAKGKVAGRVPKVRWEYLSVSGPFHHQKMQDALDALLVDIRRLAFAIEPAALKLPLMDPRTGEPLKLSGDVVASLAASVLVEQTSWLAAVSGLRVRGATHFIDVGPGEGVARVTSSALKGRGVAVLACARPSDRAALLHEDVAPARPIPFEAYGPQLAQLPSGELVVDNRFTRATHRAPVILPGMTPTTVEAPIVIAAANAGYVAELAGGGQVTERILRARLDEVAAGLAPGQGIVFNALYLDPYLWGLHFAKERLVIKLKDEGYPIVGVTVSAGVPPVDEAVSLLRELCAHGITLNALKPGNDRELDEVMAIADVAPELTLHVHLEGGRAGGHHSWEDLDDLLIRHYAKLRARANVVLAVGGGIATEDQASAYLTGEWSEALGFPIMPVDAVFLGTRLMACREARTSDAVKAALAGAPGSDAWPLDGKVEGAVTSGKSQLDASIYYLENAAAKAGRLLDEVAGDAEKVAARRDEIVAALSVTAKPYFGDLEKMSYGEVLARFVELTCFGRGSAYEDGPWPDISYRARFCDLFRRVEERFVQEAGVRSLLDDAPGSDAPFAQVDALRARYPEVTTSRLHPEDVRFFLDLCRRPGKPVCFVPVIDENVRRWFKADSLWQAHDPRYPAHAVLTIPGPRGVKGIVKQDEPVADVLGAFTQHLVERLGAKKAERRAIESRADLSRSSSPLLEKGTLVPRPDEVSAPEGWFARLGRLGHGPLAAALGEPNAVTLQAGGAKLVVNPLRALLRPTAGASFSFALDERGRLVELRSLTPEGKDAARLRLSAGLLEVTLLARRGGFAGEDEREVSLDLALTWVEEGGAGWLRWDREAYLDAQRAFYGALLFGADVVPVDAFTEAREETALSTEQLRAFRAATRDDARGVSPQLAFPLAWKAIFRALAGARADVLKLVHEDNEIEIAAWPPRADEPLEVTAKVIELEHLPAGRRVVTRARLHRRADGALLATVTSRFFIRDTIDMTPGDVDRRLSHTLLVNVRDEAEADFLASQPWWTGERARAGDTLLARIDTDERRRGEHTEYRASGEVCRVLASAQEVLARVELTSETGGASHPVLASLELLKAAEPSPEGASALVGQKRVTAPRRLEAYAAASGDRNPLHTELGVARFAGFDAPIVHGMWTAATALHRVARLATGGDVERVARFLVRFTAPVSRGEELLVVVKAVSARGGQRQLEVEVRAGHEGRVVLSGEATLVAPKSAYVFPGQGIQAPGMGMDGYARSTAAKAVWDEADGVCRRRFGFSLLDVVKNNPRELWVQGERVAHPEGVLFLTQFTQVAMAVMAVAQARELEEQGLLVPDARFAGHSLGEYSALAALSGVMPLEGVVSIVYHRGLTMDRLVTRDAEGRSPYAMGVIRPHLAGLDEAGAFALVEDVRRSTGLPVEVVNHNVRGRQYSVTGHADALLALERKLGKGAWVPVPGIDVPFHSTLLRDGVDAFRKTLDAALPERTDADALEHKYLPNLTGTSFELSERFFAEVFEACGSPRVEAWRKALADGADRGRLAREVLIEVLAYQFASPVRWIQTQDRLLHAIEGVESYIEVGAAHQPTLANMAKSTLASSKGGGAQPRVLHSELDRPLLLGPVNVEEDEAPAAPVAAAKPAPDVSADAGKVVEEAAAPAAAPAAPATQGTGASLPEVSLVEDGVRTLLALQTKRRPEQVPFEGSLDALLGGNSARRNQVLADLAAELEARAVDGAHEMPLRKLVAALADKAEAYRGSGPYLVKARATALARVLGACGVDEAQIERYLADAWHIEGAHAAAVVNRCALCAREGDSAAGGPLSSAPTGRLADKAAAHAWIDAVVVAYGKEHGVALAKPSQSEAAVAVDAGALKDLEERVFGDDGVFLRAARAAAAELGLAPQPSTMSAASDPQHTRLRRFEDEHGEAYEAALAPRFDALKHVAFTSWWAWGRRDLLSLDARLRRGDEVSEGELARVGGRLDESALRMAAFLEGKARAEARVSVAQAFAAIQAAAPREVLFRPSLMGERPVAEVDEKGEISVRATPRPGAEDALAFIAQLAAEGHLDATLAEELRCLSGEGRSFIGKTAVVTGAGAGSIALEVVKALLQGGARVVVTTSGYSASRVQSFKRIYQEHAARGAELHVVPLNQGSFLDVDALATWFASAEKERVGSSERTLKEPWVPDLLVPFGAVSETAALTDLGGRSLATLRVLVLGVERLVARLSEVVRDHGRPAQRLHVLLPLSPNHGTFGGDGVYGESKAALEALLERWRSERDAWGRYATLAGARIGWVRGTGLMQQNDALAAILEDEGLRTFSAEEMGLLLTGLCTDDARARAEANPLIADLTGGLAAVADLGARLRKGRESLEGRSRYHRRLHQLNEALRTALGRKGAAQAEPLAPRARPRVRVPMPSAEDLESLPELDHLDLSRVVVIAGYGEVGPWGSARTRWDIEKDGVLSLEGVAELAWLMGLIVPREGGGFVDAATKKPVADHELHERYEQRVLENSGVRVTDSSVTGFDPTALPRLVEVHLDRDFTFAVPDRDIALAMKQQDPENTEVLEEAGRVSVVRKRGAVVRVPAALKLDRRVTGQLPTGWDAARFGVPPEMVEQVDPVTLYCLLSTAEAFLSAGIEPDELYQWMHPSKVGVTVGTGIGGMKKLHRLHRDHYDGVERQNDTLQETLINVIGGYIVQSYLGSYGAMSFPVGACATGGLSVTEGAERILSGSADFIVAGGADDLSEAGLVGFADMGATANTEELAARGVEPRHMSRPSDRRRRGFVEAHGAGALLLVRASKALQMGLPVYGVVAYAGTFGDGLQKSVPAPGQGALAAAAERTDAQRDASDACGFLERRRRIAAIHAQRPALVAALGAEEAERMLDAARREHGHEFYQGREDISPLRGGLGVLGLSADDVGVISKHDSSTQANDENEARLHTELSRALGRTAGNPLLIISQKALTGHPKGAAAAWQVNGLLQAMAEGVVPPNPSLDDVSPEMRDFPELVLSDRPLDVGWRRLKAGLVTTLGFGHVSALLCIAHPFHFWRMLSDDERASYAERVSRREERATTKLQAVLAGQERMFTKRDERPYVGKLGEPAHAEHETRVLLDAGARVGANGRFGAEG